MNSVGIDVSKGKSMVAVMRPFGEIILSPFEVQHSPSELNKLAKQLKSLDGETRVVMEATGNYHLPIAVALHKEGLFVSVVNAILVHGYNNNTLRRAKTDKKDAVKLANYGIDKWLKLHRFIPENETRMLLKSCHRQYRQYSKTRTVITNNLISLLDTIFPGINKLFTSPARADGSEKWVDFVKAFWHCECVSCLSQKSFEKKYQKWCKKKHYNFSAAKAAAIYAFAHKCTGVMPKNESTRILIEQAVALFQTVSATLSELKKEMLRLAQSLPEYPVVKNIYGLGPTLGPQLMAEIGDVRRFYSKKALVAFAGIDSPADDSGQVEGKHKGMSKIGSPALRRTLFVIMSVYLQNAPLDQPVYIFMDKKRSENKPFRVYMMAAANKFLRIYYATVKKYLDSLDKA